MKSMAHPSFPFNGYFLLCHFYSLNLSNTLVFWLESIILFLSVIISYILPFVQVLPDFLLGQLLQFLFFPPLKSNLTEPFCQSHHCWFVFLFITRARKCIPVQVFSREAALSLQMHCLQSAGFVHLIEFKQGFASKGLCVSSL